MKKVLILTCILFNYASLTAQSSVSAAEVKNHLDQVITVCDRIIDAKYLENSMTRPTLLNVGGAYPNHLLTIVINYEDRKNFPFNPEQYYVNKRVCITGTVSDFKGKPQIVARTAAEIKVDESQARTTGNSSAGAPNRTATTTQPNINTPTKPAINSGSEGNNTNSPVAANRTNSSPLDSANRTTSPVTSTSSSNTTTPAGSANPSNATSPITSPNRNNTTGTTGSAGTANTPGLTSSSRTGSAANSTASNNGVSATGPTSSTVGANTTNRTSDTNNSSSAYTIEIGPNLRVRSGPGETYSVIEVAKAGTEVTILGSENGWSHVSYQRSSADQGQTITIEGYIKNSVLTAADKLTATNTTATTTSAKKTNAADVKAIDNDANKKAAVNSKNSDIYSIKISSSLRVRSEPAETSDVIEVIKPGTVVSVIRSENGWSYVSYPGNSSSAYAKNQTQKGYIKNSVLK